MLDDDTVWQPVERFGQQTLKGDPVLARQAAIGPGRSVDAALERVLTEHHLRVVGEVAIHLNGG